MGDWRSGPRAMPEPQARSRPMERERDRDRDRDRERERDCKYFIHPKSFPQLAAEYTLL